MCYFDDSDGCTVSAQTMRTARRTHRCGECDREISRGERYEYVTMLFDGSWSVAKTCGQCKAAREWLSAVCSGWVYELVSADLREHVYEGYASVGLCRLVIGMQNDWRWRPSEPLVPVETVERWCADALAKIPNEYRGAA